MTSNASEKSELIPDLFGWIPIFSAMGLAIALGLVAILATLFTRSRPYVPMHEDRASATRLEILSAMLRSRFGRHWPYLLLTFSVLLLIIAIALSLQGQGQPWVIQFQNSTRITMLLVALLVLLGLGIVILFVYLYLQQSRDAVDALEDQKKREEFLYTVALLMILLFGLTWFVAFVWRT